MHVDLVLYPDAIALMRADTKAQVLERVAGLFASAYGFDEASVLEHLQAREALGSTGFGRGVAIPHCRLDAVNGPTLAVLRLQSAIEFAAVDALPVNLVFGLVSPVDAGPIHLHALAAISRLTREDAALQGLLEATSAGALHALLSSQFLRDAA